MRIPRGDLINSETLHAEVDSSYTLTKVERGERAFLTQRQFDVEGIIWRNAELATDRLNYVEHSVH